MPMPVLCLRKLEGEAYTTCEVMIGIAGSHLAWLDFAMSRQISRWLCPEEPLP